MNTDALTSAGRVRPRLAAVAAFACALAVALAATPGDADAAVGPTDLQLTKTDTPDPVTEGGTLTYAVEVRNLLLGPNNDASNVVVTDRLDNQLDFVSVQTTQGTCDRNGPNITCELGTVLAGQTQTVTIVVRPRREGTIANAAQLTSPQDTNPANNADTELTTVVGGGPSCGGRTATILGTAGDDTITGTDRPDVIVSFGGADTILSSGGNDVVCSRSGADTVRGGSGGDRLIGGSGPDKLAGKSGNDVLKGKGGRDRLRGRGGFDVLNGGAGRDSCKGGAGRDKEKRCP
jgi:uncharacterized repeat protein (TIGR01451 family)